VHETNEAAAMLQNKNKKQIFFIVDSSTFPPDPKAEGYSKRKRGVEAYRTGGSGKPKKTDKPYNTPHLYM